MTSPESEGPDAGGGPAGVESEPSASSGLTTAPATPDVPPPARPGVSTFTIEGRAAPGLFVVGWLAALAGLGALIVSVLAPPGAFKTILFIGSLVLLSIGLVAGAGAQGIERRARGEAYRGPSPFLVFAASIPTAVLLLVVLAIPLALVGIELDGPVGRLLSVAGQAVIYAALIRLLVVDVGALTWSGMGLVRPPSGPAAELLRGAAWAVPVILLTIPVSAILLQLFPVEPVSPLPPTGQVSGFLIQLVAGAVVAPMGEELFFRGFATTAWVRSIGVSRGMVRAALFFAFVHVLTIEASSVGEGAQLALVGFATRIPVGLALGWLFVRRGNIWAPLGLHAAFNGILLVIGEAAVR
ncbi:MAG: CPBP family intramembrane glutamic endopeptidase [Chloroflexota bacterium]